jgi:hypothetical protein
MLRRNTQKLLYANYINEEVKQYVTDSDGNIQYMEIDGEQIPIEKGSKYIEYGKPKELFSSLQMGGSEAEAVEYGLSLSEYDCTLVIPKNICDMKEGSLVWYTSEVEYKDTDKTQPDKTSADYQCVKVSPNINYTKYVLKALVKNG